MPRVLSAVRARVPLPEQPGYRRVAAALSQRMAARGQHLWVFRSSADPELLLEFREARSREALQPADADEAGLSQRLSELASYDPAEPLWEELALAREG